MEMLITWWPSRTPVIQQAFVQCYYKPFQNDGAPSYVSFDD